MSYNQSLQHVFNVEIHTLKQLQKLYQEKYAVVFQQVCEKLSITQGKIIVMGLGKTGHIGKKIAATLASTGTPAFFVHAAEAAHGDLGMITPQDVVLAISQSGKSNEIQVLLPILKREGTLIIAMTGNLSSPLAEHADFVLPTIIEQEACPNNLAPTSSTTAALVLGDALAVALLTARGFSPQDFARSHPGGALGKRLLVTVKNVMRSYDRTPKVLFDANLTTILNQITEHKLGMTAVLDEESNVLGIITDGDIRRMLQQPNILNEIAIGNLIASDLIKNHHKATTITDTALMEEVLHLFEKQKINQILVVNDSGQLCGAFNIHDLFMAKVL